MGKKRGIVLALLIIVLCMPLFAAADKYDTAVTEIVSSFAKVLGSDTPVAFISVDSDSEGFARRFMSDVERELVNSDVYVLDRSNIDAMISELEFQTSGLVDDDRAVSIGHMLGARMIISAKANNMVSAYHVDIQLIDIETTLVKRHLVYDLKYDTNLRNILNGTSSNIGSQKIGIGARGGMAFEFNKAHEDMVGTGLRPGEESPKSIVPTLSIFYRVLDNLKLQVEFSYFITNGISIYDYYTEDADKDYLFDIDIKYSTLEIPVLLAWNFIQKPLNVDIFGGAYVSVPVSAVMMSMVEKYSEHKAEAALDASGFVYGVVGGFDVGFRIGPGNLVLDARYFYDLVPTKARGDLIGGESGLLYRKGVVVSAGFSFEL